MLSGQRAFHNVNAADTMSAILNEEPADISQLLPTIPSALQWVVRRCLEKKREQRFQSASDLAFALEALSDSRMPGIPVGLGRTWRRPNRLFAIVGIACVVAVLLAYRFRPAMPFPYVTRVVQLTESGGVRRGDSLLTDGPRVYYQSAGPLGKDSQPQAGAADRWSRSTGRHSGGPFSYSRSFAG